VLGAIGDGACDFAVEMASGVVHMVRHPIDSATAVYQTVRDPSGLVERVCAHYRQVYDRVAHDPLLTQQDRVRLLTKEALELATAVTGVAGVARGVAKGAVSVATRSTAVVEVAATAPIEVASAITYTRQSGRLRPRELTKQELGALGEAAVARIYETRTMKDAGWRLHDAKIGSNNGFDGVAVRYGGDGQVLGVRLHESKATLKPIDQARPSFGNTKHGRQTTSEWIAHKIAVMRSAPQPQLRHLAATIEHNLHQTRVMLNVYSEGLNHWTRQSLLPEAAIDIPKVQQLLLQGSAK
jgi:hypothetical protein